MAKKIQNEEPRENVLDVIRLLAKERGIEEEALIKSIEEGMVAAFKREFSGDKDKSQIKNVQAEIDRETGEIFVYKLVTVVEEVLDPDNEIAYDEARAMDDEIELGDEIEIGIEVDKLGRLAASAAKSAISQKVRDAEYRRIQDEFSGRIGEIATGVILRNDARNIYVDIDRAEAVLPREGQIRGEVYRQNASMKFLVQCVEEHNGHPSITLSRTSVDLVKKLFELEVPEIKNGEVIINAVSREPGSRSKVAVYSRDENVDAKGACVGPRGARVQHIMEELGGEKIDIVDWNADPALFISEALQPAKVIRVDTEITKKEDGSVESYAKVIVPDQQFTLAIGRSGQNVRLAARLTGFKIDIKKESDEASEATQMMLDKFTVVEEDNGN